MLSTRPRLNEFSTIADAEFTLICSLGENQNWQCQIQLPMLGQNAVSLFGPRANQTGMISANDLIPPGIVKDHSLRMMRMLNMGFKDAKGEFNNDWKSFIAIKLNQQIAQHRLIRVMPLDSKNPKDAIPVKISFSPSDECKQKKYYCFQIQIKDMREELDANLIRSEFYYDFSKPLTDLVNIFQSSLAASIPQSQQQALSIIDKLLDQIPASQQNNQLLENISTLKEQFKSISSELTLFNSGLTEVANLLSSKETPSDTDTLVSNFHSMASNAKISNDNASTFKILIVDDQWLSILILLQVLGCKAYKNAKSIYQAGGMFETTLESKNANSVDLPAKNIHIILAADGSRGLELFKTYCPDLLITDIMMPKMSGDELIVKIMSAPAETRHNNPKRILVNTASNLTEIVNINKIFEQNHIKNVAFLHRESLAKEIHEEVSKLAWPSISDFKEKELPSSTIRQRFFSNEKTHNTAKVQPSNSRCPSCVIL